MQLWRYEGLKTLRDYMRRKDCINALAIDLRVPEHVVIPTVISHLLQSVVVRLLPLSPSQCGQQLCGQSPQHHHHHHDRVPLCRSCMPSASCTGT